MNESTIRLQVSLDDKKIPENIQWSATSQPTEGNRQAKAFLLSLWDGQEKTALRIDLWTKNMMVDEMDDFFYQTLVTLADTYQRATQHTELAGDIKTFAQSLYKKARALQLKDNKLQ